MTNTVQGQTLLTTAQVAHAYGLAEYLLKDAVKAGTIPVCRVGRQKLMERADVEEWIRKGAPTGAGEAAHD